MKVRSCNKLELSFNNDLTFLNVTHKGPYSQNVLRLKVAPDWLS